MKENIILNIKYTNIRYRSLDSSRKRLKLMEYIKLQLILNFSTDRSILKTFSFINSGLNFITENN